ncbi:unnamed protein product [Protopolystoma xenopodis]|uniref:Uncharacterized protein n=1 Tax=Protopolystoma xenopodis TaxID=117903 RepID=A0A3S5FDA6_9PLAT|nr:unnamed protein product [Protopolystoma xenopodis]
MKLLTNSIQPIFPSNWKVVLQYVTKSVLKAQFFFMYLSDPVKCRLVEQGLDARLDSVLSAELRLGDVSSGGLPRH